MPCKCKVRSSNHHNNRNRDIPARERFPGQRNPCPGKVSWAEKLSDWERFPGLERYPGQRNICPGKVSGKSALPGKGFLGREISAQESLLWKVLMLEKLHGKSFPDCKGCSDWHGTEFATKREEFKIKKLFPEPAKAKLFPDGISTNSEKYSPLLQTRMEASFKYCV